MYFCSEYDELMNMAMESNFSETFDPNDSRLVFPENMIDAIKECLNKPDMSLQDLLSSVYHSLAKSYSEVVGEVEAITGKKVQCINIVGGGSKDTYLNTLTAKYTGKEIITGPVEATTIGNLKTQFNAIFNSGNIL